MTADFSQALTSIGLLPLSVGATSILEWMPFYASSTSTSSFLLPSRNIYIAPTSFSLSAFQLPPYYNLFSCSMRSLFLSLFSIFSSSSHPIHSLTDGHRRLFKIREIIGGTLWYQGCNDAAATDLHSDPSPGKIYSDRLSDFLEAVQFYTDWICLQLYSILFPSEDLPLCHFPSLPILVVAITTTRPWLTATQEIRFVQCSFPSLCSFSPILTVDSLGNALQADCVHLTSRSYYRLGYLLADIMKTMKTSSSDLPPIQFVYPADTIQLSPFDRYLVSLYTLIRLLSEHTLDSHYSTKRESFYPSSTFQSHYLVASDSLLTPPVPQTKSLQILQSGLKPINFVYGEISFHAILSLLREIDRIDRIHFPSPNSENEVPFTVKRNHLFVDLGCGSCVSLLAASLMGSFSNVIGVDLMRSKLEIGLLMQSMIQSYLQNPELFASRFDLQESYQQQIQEFFNQYPTYPQASLHPLNLSIREGNFLNWENLTQQEWHEIKVLYLCSTCFSESDLLKEIFDVKFSHLSLGAYVILLDQQLPESLTTKGGWGDQTGVDKCVFQLVFSSQCRTSWGVASAYIYRCTNSVY